MPSMLSVAIIALLSVSASATVSDSVSNSVYRSRGGDIVITHASPNEGDALMITVDKMGSASTASLSSDLSETSFASLVSSVLGGFTMSAEIPKQAEAFTSSVFKRPQANLVVAVPALGAKSASELSLTNIEAMRATEPTFTLTPAFEPRHPLSQLTTLLTGALPSAHGISSPSWISHTSKSQGAYTKAGSHATVPNVGDVLLKTIPGAGVVGFSGEPAFASAGAAHVRNGYYNSYSISMDKSSVSNQGKAAGFPVVRLTDAMLRNFFESEDAHSLLSALKGSVEMSFDASSRKFVFVSNGHRVVFDLNNKADRFFLAELASLNLMVQELRSGSMAGLVSDAKPDLFTVTLAGFERVTRNEEAGSLKTALAAQFVDSAVAKLIEEFGEMYSSQLTSQVVLMGSPSTVHDANARSAVIASVQSSLHSKADSESTYPTLFLSHKLSSDEVDAVCASANAAASQYNLKAECVSQLTRPILLQEKSAVGKQDSTVTNQDIVDFQLNLWVSVLLVLLLFGAVYPLFYIDVSSGIFSSFLFAKKYI